MQQPERLKLVKQTFTERAEMLAAVEPYISVRLREQLWKKIALEKEKLSSLMTFKDAEQTGARQFPYILNRAFFEKKSLNITPFE